MGNDRALANCWLCPPSEGASAPAIGDATQTQAGVRGKQGGSGHLIFQKKMGTQIFMQHFPVFKCRQLIQQNVLANQNVYGWTELTITWVTNSPD